MTWVATVLPALACLIVLARASGGKWAWISELPTALPLGIGLSSIVWWVLLQFGGPAERVAVVDLGLWLGAIVVFLLSRRPRFLPHADLREQTTESRALTCVAVVGFIAALALAVTSFAASSTAAPHGTWDAWAIWNLRARFLFLGLPSAWPDAFSSDLAYSHPDYPLLLPLSISRLWTHAGTDATTIPIALAAIFGFATVAVIGISIARARTTAHGLLAGTAMLVHPIFLQWAPAQIADVPLGFYMLLAFVLLWRASTSGLLVWWTLAGVAAGLAAWTKNEGTVFVALFVLVSVVWLLRTKGRGGVGDAASLLAGAAVGIAAVIALKWRFPAPNDVASAVDWSSAVAHLTDRRRVRFVLEAVGHQLWFEGGSVGVLPIVIAYALIAGLRRVEGVPAVALVVVLLQIAAYILVYIVTPHDLRWHLDTSLSRVLLQIVPSAVWGIMMLTRC
jgi:hypothetical protein